MGETTWAHLGILGVFLAAIIPVWLDLRNRSKITIEESRKNGERLVSIETKLDPMWSWFNNGRNKE